MRVERPMSLDFAELAEGVRKNNMGVGGLRFQANATVRDSVVKLERTGQTFVLAGAAAPEGGPAWRTFQVLAWEDRTRMKVEVVP